MLKEIQKIPGVLDVEKLPDFFFIIKHCNGNAHVVTYPEGVYCVVLYTKKGEYIDRPYPLTREQVIATITEAAKAKED